MTPNYLKTLRLQTPQKGPERRQGVASSQSVRREHSSEQKEFFESKRLMFKIKEQQRLEKMASGLIKSEMLKKSDVEARLETLIRFMTELEELAGRFKDCVKGDMLNECLRGISKLVENNSSFTFICAKLLYFLGKLHYRLFHLEECERNLLFAEMLSRICDLLPLTMEVLEQLIRLYLKQSRIQATIEKALSMLYIAVYEARPELESHSLGILSICYFYEGNIAKSCFYYTKSLTGVDEEERASIRMSFDNAVNIAALERLISGEPVTGVLQSIEREPYDNEKLESFEHLNQVENRAWPLHFKKILNEHPVKKVGRRLVLGRKGIHKSSMGNNTSQIYRTHQSTNREWENFIVLHRNRALGE